MTRQSTNEGDRFVDVDWHVDPDGSPCNDHFSIPSSGIKRYGVCLGLAWSRLTIITVPWLNLEIPLK